MAEAGAWSQIQRDGLLSTSALLDRFGIAGEQRVSIESRRRPQIVTISHPQYGTAQIRDNKPLREQFLKCLPGTARQEFIEILNGKVFFWVRYERLETLIGARAYCKRAHDVLTVDSAELLARHLGRASLASFNTGSTLYPTAPPRGRETFTPIEQFDWDAARRRRGRQSAIVELTVDYAVPDIAEFVVKAERWLAGRPIQTLYER